MPGSVFRALLTWIKHSPHLQERKWRRRELEDLGQGRRARIISTAVRIPRAWRA